METAAIILAAGEGTRMKSRKPKVVHEVLGKPLVKWVIDRTKEAGIDHIVTVVGFKHEMVTPIVEGKSQVVIQPVQRGTADAVNVCREALSDFDGSLLVLSGDCPLITSQTIASLVQTREKVDAGCVVLTMELEDPTGYGRIIRDETEQVARIVEQRDASPSEAAINECNSGFYCFDARTLFNALEQVGNTNAQNEYYLTDVIDICRKQGKSVLALKAEDPSECLGVNSRRQLAEATKKLQLRINGEYMDNGVTMLDPDLVWIGPDVVIAPDVELLPMVVLHGETSIGTDSVIGPNTRLTDTTVGEGCTIDETVAIEATIDNNVKCGPRAYLRPGAHLCDGSKAGTHVEIKKSTIGKGSKVPHLSYIGDCEMGEGVNIGAGTITCNYDGVHKHKTIIGNDVFVGSDTMLVAPVEVGDRALIGAGSCITKDVSEGALALGRARQTELKGWVDTKTRSQ